MSYTSSPSAAVSQNPYGTSSAVSALPVPLQCETTYLVMQNFGGTNTVTVKLDKQLFNHPDFFHKMGCYPYHNKSFADRSGTMAPMSPTSLDGSSYLLNNDDIEAHLSVKAQGILNACGNSVSSVTFHYVATFAEGHSPSAFTQMIVCNPPAIVTGTHMTTQTDVLVQNALIGFFATPPLNTSEVTAFTATYVFTPLPAKK